MTRISPQLFNSHFQEQSERPSSRQVRHGTRGQALAQQASHTAVVAGIHERPNILGNDGLEEKVEGVGELGVGFTLGEDLPQHVCNVQVLTGVHVQQVI